MQTPYAAFVDERFNLGTGGIPDLPYVALALCGEAGEFAEKVKKLYRDASGVRTFETTTALALELGDILFYLTKATSLLGLSVMDVEELNTRKLLDRASRGTRRGSGDER